MLGLAFQLGLWGTLVLQLRLDVGLGFNFDSVRVNGRIWIREDLGIGLGIRGTIRGTFRFHCIVRVGIKIRVKVWNRARMNVMSRVRFLCGGRFLE